VIDFTFASEEIARNAATLLKSKFEVEEIQTKDSSLHLHIRNGEKTMPELLRSLDAKHLEVQSIMFSRPSLDDVFLKYTGRSLREDERK
jgi:ABC-2 type transport system ATP-binding protein